MTTSSSPLISAGLVTCFGTTTEKVNSAELEPLVKHLRGSMIQVLNSSDLEPQCKKLLDALVKTVIEEFYSLHEEKNMTVELFSRKAKTVLLSSVMGILAVSIGKIVTTAATITGSIHQVLQLEVGTDFVGGTLHTVVGGSLSRDCDVEKNGKWSCIYAVGSQEYQMVCTRLDIASEDVGMLDKFDRVLQTYVQVFMDYDYTVGRSITVMAAYMTLTEAAKEAIWLKGLAIESGFMLKIVVCIATGALSKTIPGPRFQHRSKLLCIGID
ncbi:hypothetical protein Tco_0872086 [Tanacetum coccineum]